MTSLMLAEASGAALGSTVQQNPGGCAGRNGSPRRDDGVSFGCDRLPGPDIAGRTTTASVGLGRAKRQDVLEVSRPGIIVAPGCFGQHHRVAVLFCVPRQNRSLTAAPEGTKAAGAPSAKCRPCSKCQPFAVLCPVPRHRGNWLSKDVTTAASPLQHRCSGVQVFSESMYNGLHFIGSKGTEAYRT
jgi:hypothetical protein